MAVVRNFNKSPINYSDPFDLAVRYENDFESFKDYEILEFKNRKDWIKKNPLEYNYLYVIYNKNTTFYKIGITTEIKHRIRQLVSQSGCEMHLVFLVSFEEWYDEDPAIAEAYLHLYFKKKRKIGEWFTLSPRDLVQIKVWASLHAELEYYPLKNKTAIDGK